MRKAAPAVDYRFLDIILGHPGQVVERKEERRWRLRFDFVMWYQISHGKEERGER